MTLRYRISRHPLYALLSIALSVAFMVRAEVTLPSVWASNMVIQQEMPIVVWGWAEPSEKITVKLDDQTQSAEANAKGDWRVTLPALKADGKVHTLIVSGKNTITLENILLGEVWIGSGQSNMAMGQKGVARQADKPQIRLFQVPSKMSKKPERTVEAEWKVCTPELAGNFSAALFYFGEKLHTELKVPIGLISAAKGSTAIQQFMPPPSSGPLYNGAIAPLIPIAIRGIIWYQGEANVMSGDGLAYFDRQKTMLEGWRKEWGRDFPFYLVQIAPLKNYAPDLLPPLWEAQAQTLKLPNTGMIVTTDLAGNMSGIHPANKKDVGLRLARWALAKEYGRKDIVFSGPLYKSMTVEGKHIRLVFAHAEGLKAGDGKTLTEFEIAGADKRFVAARATIDGQTIVVESDEIAQPLHVRFAWRNAPSPNLYNGADLPAAPFQTDNWHGGTAE